MPDTSDNKGEGSARYSAPAISLPKGGGAIRGIGEKFAANPVTGTGSMSVPLAVSPGRSGFGPQLSLSYDSGSGNGPFGFGWHLSLPQITRKTDKGLPRYQDAIESDEYIYSGFEDLVPLLKPDGTRFEDRTTQPGFTIHRYLPRVENSFARIERWTDQVTGNIHWRSITRDNITTVYGTSANSRVSDPQDARCTFTWLICESYDDTGNAIRYVYAAENDDNIDLTQVNERNRVRTANRYPKGILYGNTTPRVPGEDLSLRNDWLFEVVFDYSEGHVEDVALNPAVPEAEQHRFVRAANMPLSNWAPRPDPFSSHRSGFEVRTYRRCARVLMFHRFDELGAEPCLVRSTEFDYDDLDYSQPTNIEAELAHQGSTRFASFLHSATQSGFVRDENVPVQINNEIRFVTYLKKSMPQLELEYSKAVIQDDIRELDEASLENLPVGLEGNAYRWVDLDGEGISGVLTQQANSWFYKPNLGGGRFGSVEPLKVQPSLSGLNSGQQQLVDLAGDGALDLVSFAGPVPGFYERTDDGRWESFQPLRYSPNVRWDDPNLRFVDLNGDGHADILITEHQVFTWYPSLAEDGFGPSVRVRTSLDEEKGARLVFADGTQSIYLADMCGDGLSDLVRIRNGEVCYWPNLGYGHFGPKVSMDGAPRFDNVDQFSQSRIRLADIDGSGATDIIYLGRDTARIYFNQSGNQLSEPHALPQFPSLETLSTVTTADLLGNGTTCLIWSSPLPADVRQPIRYIDLMGGIKPHLLVKAINNLGAETRIHYASSTQFYLADKAGGKPWITKLPFPVHVVERTEHYDWISRNRFVTRNAYHHGFFDGYEREFRGFGMVEQWDTEELGALTDAGEFPVAVNIDESSAVPPIWTKTWFHTGVYLAREHVSDYFAGLVDASDRGEYYREPGLTDAQARAMLLNDTVLPDGLSAEEEREACRALKGAVLREEVYALDGSVKESHPYTVKEQNFTIEVLQHRHGNKHAVYLTHPRESLTYHYERISDDPRVSHLMTLEVDAFGNVLKDANIGYGRRQPDLTLEPEDRDRQTQVLITYTENRVTNFIDEADNYRSPKPCETHTYELTGVTFAPAHSRFTLEEMLAAGAGAVELAYDGSPAPGVIQKRLIEHVRTIYRRDDLTGPLLLGDLESLALTFESYKLALTPALVNSALGTRVTNAMLQAAGYVHSEGDSNRWIPSGRVFLSPNPADTAAQELSFARQHFFLSHRFRDPFHTNTLSTENFVTYDAYHLLPLESRDALANLITAGERDVAGNLTINGNDYRVLRPRVVMDANRNRSTVAFDALGMVVGTAVMGKPVPALNEGDSLAGFSADLTDGEVTRYFTDPLNAPQLLLGNASIRVIYDLFRYQRTKALPVPLPAACGSLSRETHSSEPVPAGGLKIQHSFSYSDGFGREIQKKVQAEAGTVPTRDAQGRIIVGPDGQPVMAANAVSPRWIGNGWIIYNNKGKAVREYEPFFTDTHQFEFDVRIGVSPILFYDPVLRIVVTLHPDHTWEKIKFDPWREESWDANDTVLVADPSTDPDVGDFFRRLPADDYLPTWYTRRVGGALGPSEKSAAAKALFHAATPTVSHADSLGRTFLAVAHNSLKYSDTPAADPPVHEFYRTRTIFDIEGNQREVIDARDRSVMRYRYDMLGSRIHQIGMESGERWSLNDVAGNPLYSWDSLGRQYRTVYDQLRRHTDSLVLEAGAVAEIVAERIEYGEGQPSAQLNNLRGRVYRTFDQAGIVTTGQYDFKGNLLRGERQLAQSYNQTLDWSGAVTIQPEKYSSATRYDALNRTIQLISPHGDQPGATVNVIQPAYNEANLLNQVDAWLNRAAEPAGLLPPATANLHEVTNIDYDAKGQRVRIDYGNNVSTTNTFDPFTFRLRRAITRRNLIDFSGDCPQPPLPGWPGCEAQNLQYTYDPAGNITHIRDDAQQTLYFRNLRVEPFCEYTYDAVYRLIEAAGREHLGQVAAPPTPSSYNDIPRIGVSLSNSDGNAMGRYLERYLYDHVGNFDRMVHIGTNPANSGWTRRYFYDEPSQIQPLEQNNSLTRTTIGAITETYSTGANGYDVQGNMLRMPHLQEIQWDFKNQLRMTRRQAVNAEDVDGNEHAGERTWYVYDSQGQRVRKVTEFAGGAVREERIYLGGFEVYIKRGVNALVRETLHIMDNTRRVALIETRVDQPEQLIRFQYDNHLGSAILELDERARIISYEEYTPFGSTSFQAVRSNTETSKRYRFTSKERDEENGLYYHGARYYIPWLGRWINCDPAGLVDGTNVYSYVRNRPTNATDPTGMWEWDTRTVLIVAAVVTVAVVVTVATAGVGTAAVGALVAGAGGAGSAAGAAVSVAGTIAVAAGSGAAGSVAATAVSNSLTDRQDSLRDAAVAGAVTGVVTLGVGAAIGAAGRSAATASRAAVAAGTATRVQSAVATASTAINSSRAAASGVRAATGAVTGFAGGATYETTRQVVSGEASRNGVDGSRILNNALAGGAFGTVANPVLEPAVRPTLQASYAAGINAGTSVRSSALTALSARTGNNYIIGQHGQVAGRSVVTIATPEGPQAYYQRSGGGTQNPQGAQAGDWSPFEGFSRGGRPARALEIDGTEHPGTALGRPLPEGWFVKDRINWGLSEANDPLFKWGNPTNRARAEWLGGRVGPSSVERPWQTVQGELGAARVPLRDPVAGTYYAPGP